MPRRVYDGFCKVDIVGGLEVVRVTDSVSILFYDATNDRVLLVRQPRPAIASADNPEGYITETVAGRFDKNLGVKALAVQEAKEEAGVEIEEDDVLLLNGGRPMALSAGIITEHAYLAFAELNPDRAEEEERIFGVESEGERISRVWVPTAQFLDGRYCCEDLRVFTLRLWFSVWMKLTHDRYFTIL